MNQVGKNIVTKRGNRSASIITKGMSRLQIGLQKVVLDQKAKTPFVVVTKDISENEQVYTTYKNKGISVKLRELAYKRYNPLSFMVRRIPVEPHYGISEMGLKKLQKIRNGKR